MKNLLLMRHATTAEKVPGQTDLERVLTPWGERQAVEAGAWLQAQQLQPELVMRSPAVRTEATLAGVFKGLATQAPVQVEREIYYGTETELRELIQNAEDSVGTLLLIGHNPVLSHLASLLTAEHLSFAPATVAWLHFPETSWQALRPDSCVLVQLFMASL